jgi:hypothetical protein
MPDANSIDNTNRATVEVSGELRKTTLSHELYA